MLSTIWTLGDFTGVQFFSGGAPAMSSDVLATLGVRFAFDHAPAARGGSNAIILWSSSCCALHMRELQLCSRREGGASRRTSAFGLNVGIKAGKIAVIALPSRHESGDIYHRAGATALGHLRPARSR